MTETTYEQDAFAHEMAVKYGRSRVQQHGDPQHRSVLVVGMIDDIEMSMNYVGPNGEPACQSCGSVEEVEGTHYGASYCWACRDNILAAQS